MNDRASQPPGRCPARTASIETRSRLLASAIREFGAKGLLGASTRSIAAAADTVVSAITYHFGSKRGLYLAVAEHIAVQLPDGMEAALAAAENVGDDDPTSAHAAVLDLMQGYVDGIANGEAAAWWLFLMREQLRPDVAFERMWSGAVGRFWLRLTDLVRSATETTYRDAAITTMTLLAQAHALRGSSRALKHLYGREMLDPTLLDLSGARMVANVDAILISQAQLGRTAASN